MNQANNLAQVDVLADLRGVVRIAKAASVGVTGNGPRIQRAEQTIVAVAELVAAVSDVYVEQCGEPCVGPCPSCRIYAALRPFTGSDKA